MTVDQLIEALKPYAGRDLLLVLRDEDDCADGVHYFPDLTIEKLQFDMRGAQQTDDGDRDILRLTYKGRRF